MQRTNVLIQIFHFFLFVSLSQLAGVNHEP